MHSNTLISPTPSHHIAIATMLCIRPQELIYLDSHGSDCLCNESWGGRCISTRRQTLSVVCGAIAAQYRGQQVALDNPARTALRGIGGMDVLPLGRKAPQRVCLESAIPR